MNRGAWIGILIAIAAVAIGWMMLQPMAQQEEGPYPAPDADFGSVVTISNARVALPDSAGERAAVLVEMANRGDRNLFLSEIVVEHGGRAQLMDFTHPTPRQLDSVEIEPGQTVRFARAGERVILTEYDENVVPGAELNVEFTFGNGQSLTVPATVEFTPEGTGSEAG